MSRNIENHDSVLLLQDCIAGCKMALESMDDIREHTDDKQLRELIDKYYDEHTGLSVDCRDMLDKAGADIKEPGVFAKMAAKLQTAMKMAVNDDQSQAAKLLTEGCNMGIETISGSLNEYRDADSKSVAIAERLRTLEEKMVGDLQPLLSTIYSHGCCTDLVQQPFMRSCQASCLNKLTKYMVC